MRASFALSLATFAVAATGSAMAAAQAAPATPVTMTAAATVPGPPPVTWFDPFRIGDTMDPAAGPGGGPTAMFEPLRLGLLAPSVPRAFGEPGCESSLDAAGARTAAYSGVSSQAASALRLVPRLTLYGFSRMGCGVDSAVGGGIVRSVPLRPKMWLVGSAGMILLPHNGPGGAPVTRTNASVDLLLERPGRRALTVGVGTNGVMFGMTGW